MQEHTIHEESNIECLRRHIEEQYQGIILNVGYSHGDFDQILCYEIHRGDDTVFAGLTFDRLAKKWGISVTTLGELIYDHCKRLEHLPKVTHINVENLLKCLETSK